MAAATVKAARLHGNKDVRIEQLPAPTKPLAEGEVRIAPAWVGICGTDVGEYLHGPIICSTHTNPHPLSGETLPLVWGHEFSAVVTEAHSSVKNLHVGSRVAIEPYKVDGTCAKCRAGQLNQCDQIMCLGIHADGGMVASMTIPATLCYALPDSVSLELGALVEPLAVAWHGIVASGIKPGESALVIGTGPIGLATVCCLEALGIKRIVVSGRSSERNETVKKWGVCEAVLNSKMEDVVKRTVEVFDGLGAETVFDTACTHESLDVGIDTLRKAGCYYSFGFYHEALKFDMNKVVMKAIKITGDVLYQHGVFPSVIKAIEDGRLDKDILNSMITTRIGLEDVEEKGIKELINNKSKHIKILIKVNELEGES